MKIRDKEELKNKSALDLASALKNSREEMRVLKLDLAAGKVKNFSLIRVLRRKIARILTFLNESSKEK